MELSAGHYEIMFYVLIDHTSVAWFSQFKQRENKRVFLDIVVNYDLCEFINININIL